MAKIERDGIEMAERNMTACLAQGDGEGARFWREVAKAHREALRELRPEGTFHKPI
jgi:hypothetical protein